MNAYMKRAKRGVEDSTEALGPAGTSWDQLNLLGPLLRAFLCCLFSPHFVFSSRHHHSSILSLPTFLTRSSQLFLIHSSQLLVIPSSPPPPPSFMSFSDGLPLRAGSSPQRVESFVPTKEHLEGYILPWCSKFLSILTETTQKF